MIYKVVPVRYDNNTRTYIDEDKSIKFFWLCDAYYDNYYINDRLLKLHIMGGNETYVNRDPYFDYPHILNSKNLIGEIVDRNRIEPGNAANYLRVFRIYKVEQYPKATKQQDINSWIKTIGGWNYDPTKYTAYTTNTNTIGYVPPATQTAYYTIPQQWITNFTITNTNTYTVPYNYPTLYPQINRPNR